MVPADLHLPSDLVSKLDDAVRRIVDLARPDLVILFGSYAEGRHNEGSDVDLLIVAETDSWVDLAVRLRGQLEPVLAPLEFDVLIYTPEAWETGRRVRGFVTWEADRKGVRLYGAPR